MSRALGKGCKRPSVPAPFTKVSEWIAAGNMKTGYYTLERVARETEKAIGFQAEKYNEYGNLKPATCWIARSHLQVVENDYYVRGPTTMYLVAEWLYRAKTEEGFVL